MRPLAPTTQAQYERIRWRASQGSFAEWKPSQKALLRAAAYRAALEAGEDPSTARARLSRELPIPYTVRRELLIPGEIEAEGYRTKCQELTPGVRALVLLPLALGLRAREVCGLTRGNIRRAIASGELIALRKGGRERVLPAVGVRALLAEALEVPAASGRYRLNQPARAPHAWECLGEILSPSKHHQYHKLRTLIHRTGECIKLTGLRPHLLRHAFATRMNRDGAPLGTIQAALDHQNIATTARYVHADLADVAKYSRDFNGAVPEK